ncbi:exonuclease 3'-5' domain containing 1 [Seminavis robusta]|uniref:Exonuclease 3'-5' domain containing 1 n=1 Tax=Seminavis robusta TaxID=568900 RepID=A0A9N8HHB0_9STRA|nr:exonuclease 3'-5' domain containing 1 [Seminavis robusta]|eukprot:Sro553_g165210.1 exonuclease 3'-5' domain containing 1 (182) ;mRNA; r:1575-2120
MDSDALYHQLGITLQSVHDTSCFHKVITRQESPASLNKALVAHGIEANQTRDSSVYKSNPRFWATRPLTAKMKAWASSDVDKLLELATKQVSILTTKGKTQLQNAFNLSIRSARLLRDMQLERYCYCKIPERQFIGAGGSNIRSVEKRTGTYIRSRSTDKEWLIYYDSNHGLSMAKKAMGY